MKDLRNEIVLRNMEAKDCIDIPIAFKAQGWDKPKSQYQDYCQCQLTKERDVIIAEYKKEFAGYLTIKWASDYEYFRENEIPEIVDFNVLKKFQRKGIGSLLIDEAEKRIKLRSDKAGIGVGMYADYGPAQILYVRRKYVPDGKGIYYDNKKCSYGNTVRVDDSLTIHLIKKLAD